MIFNTILSILIWFATVCIVSALVLYLLTFLYPPVKHSVLKKVGARTIGKVISSHECDDSEDVCICGVFSYHDSHDWEHKVSFRYCLHWPSIELWEKVMQSCSPGAENTVQYLAWFPFIREIQWNVDNPEIGERTMENSVK